MTATAANLFKDLAPKLVGSSSAVSAFFPETGLTRRPGRHMQLVVFHRML
jgi:hypothetical protein